MKRARYLIRMNRITCPCTVHLAKLSVNSEDLAENIVEENKWYIQLLFIEDSEASLRIPTKLLVVNTGNIIPTGKGDRSVEGLISVDCSMTALSMCSSVPKSYLPPRQGDLGVGAKLYVPRRGTDSIIKGRIASHIPRAHFVSSRGL